VTYSKLLRQYTILQQQYQCLEKENLVLNAEKNKYMHSMSYIFHTWYRTLYQTLASSIAQKNPFNPNPSVTNSNFNTRVLPLSADPSHLCDASEIQADYLLVKYWHKRNWTTLQKVKREITKANRVAPK